MENIIYECAALGVDVVLFSVFYKLYRNRSQNAKAVGEAPSLEIDNTLSNKVQCRGNVIPYAVVSGLVKATSIPLRSQYLSNIKGVIREKITKERKVRWNPMLRLWNTVEHDIQRSHNSVPFTLVGNGIWFKSSVEVASPFSAEELVLPTVYDHFISHQDSIGEAVVGWFRGERTTGIQEIENMLIEGTILTGVGELAIENEVVKLRPPSSGLTYFLTSMSLDSLNKKLNEEAKFFKILSVIVGCMGIFLLTHVVTKSYQARKRKKEEARQREMFREASRTRRLTDPSRGAQNEENNRVPFCVICLTNPVEVVILECGHTCLCLDCSEHVQLLCPVCRSPIERMVPAYLP